MPLAQQRISIANVMRLAGGGCIGGFITYLLLEPGIRDSERFGRVGSLGDGALHGIVIGTCIGGLLVLADELQSPKFLRIVKNLLIAVLTGGITGLAGAYLADLIFSPFARTEMLPLVVVGRVIGWSIMGISAGLCPGIVTGSNIRIRQGAVGGFVGGAIGGLLFDILSQATEGGTISRVVGFTVTGLAIGVAVSLIEEMGKTYWLAALNGPREGRTYILTRPRTVLGRDELVDIPLFGDRSVTRNHAAILLSPTGVTIAAEPGGSLLINGVQTTQAGLQPGDQIQIGNHRFVFHQRFDTNVSVPLLGNGYVPTNHSAGLQPINQAGAAGDYATDVILQISVGVISGPHNGQHYALINGGIVGRDPRCDIPLTGDMKLSRQHARFLVEGNSWIIEDGNSSNGVFVNGVRVFRQELAQGDQIVVGDTTLLVT